jgi:hypothetical protein
MIRQYILLYLCQVLEGQAPHRIFVHGALLTPKGLRGVFSKKTLQNGRF